jgi:succinoglycan biosynthesis transport protein ExoP
MLKTHLKRIVFGLILGLIGGALYFKLAPSVYDSLVIAFINSQADDSRSHDESSSEVSQILGVGNQQNVISEVDMLRSEDLFKRALDDAAASTEDDKLKSTNTAMEQKLFPMYDVEANKESRIVSIDVKALNPVEAAAIANAVVTEYNNQRKFVEQRSYNDAIGYVRGQMAATKALLTDTEAQMAAYQQKNGLIARGTDEQSLSGRESKLDEALSGAKTELAVQSKELSVQMSELKKRAPTMVASETTTRNPVLSQYEQKIAEMEQDRASLLTRYQPTSDKLVQIDRNLAEIERSYATYKSKQFLKDRTSTAPDEVYQELDKEVALSQVQVDALKSRIAASTTALSQVEAEAKAYPTKALRQTSLERDKQIYEDRYIKLEKQLDDLNYKANSNAKPAEDWGNGAQPNYVQVAPTLSKTVPIGGALGACLALLLSLAVESLRSTVRTSSELSGVLGLPVTATVPALKARDAQRRMRTLAEPTFLPLEGFRFMASAAALAVDTSRKVLFTGVGGGVGCSSSAAEFAVAAARMGVKTILVDADLSMMTVSKAFGVSGKPGIRDILNHTLLPSGESTLLIATEHKNLSVLPSGSGDGLGISDVPSAQLAAVLESLAPHAQLIVIDCPPFDVLADASRFIPYVDEACLVVSAKKTHLQSIMVVEKLIQRAGAHTLSIVLTETGTNEEAFSRKNRYRAKAS